jgi:hypothetical protein
MRFKSGSLKVDDTALRYRTRVVQEGDRRCKKCTLNSLVLTPLRILLSIPINDSPNVSTFIK